MGSWVHKVQGKTPFDQHNAACRCEWGVRGYDSLAPAEVVIVVDVLSFSTCVDVAVGRGAAILPYPWKDAAPPGGPLQSAARSGRLTVRRRDVARRT